MELESKTIWEKYQESQMLGKQRIVITGVGLTAPNGNNLAEFRNALLHQVSGIERAEIRHMGMLPAGKCDFDEFKHQN